MSDALPIAVGQLELAEVERLAELEAVIKRGLATFIEVGSALLEVRDARLYRDEFSTFEDYCGDRWGFTDRRARQLMAAAEIGTIVPARSEAVARELAPLRDEPETLRDTWAEVVDRHGDQPTAKVVREVVAERELRDAAKPRSLPPDFEAQALSSSPSLRRTDARRRLARAFSATAELAPGLDEIVDAVVHDDRARYLADIDRTIATWSRLRESVNGTTTLRSVR